MKKILMFFAISALLISNANAVDISGALTGTLAGNTTYNVVGYSYVPTGETLTIGAGANLVFSPTVYFSIYGTLRAEGTETDSVKFIASVPSLFWGGLRFGYSSSSASVLEYCWISDGYAEYGGGISCAASSPTIDHCTITSCHGVYGGGGIYCAQANPTISNCNISGNFSSTGSGIEVTGASNPTITNCLISGNSGAYPGGGIYIGGSSASILGCTITGNSAMSGGGIYCGYATSTVTIMNTIVEGNGSYGLMIDTSPVNITYSDFYNNTNGNIINAPAGVGTIVTVNANGDPCDVFSNIFLNPLFVNAAAGDYSLQEGSPCIDAGSPVYFDPDGTVSDIGAFYYEQTPPQLPVISLSSGNLDFPSTRVGNSSPLNLTIYNTGTGDLELYTVFTTNPVFTTDFVPDTLAPGDSLVLTVTFAPGASILYTGWLYVSSNGDPASAYLTGTGFGSLTIDLTPNSLPIQIPAGGGHFRFGLNITNNDTSDWLFDAWTVVLKPNGQTRLPAILATMLFLEPGEQINANGLSQYVPNYAPAGNYTYIGYVGQYPNTVVDSDTFTFVKLAGDGAPVHNMGWECLGWGESSDANMDIQPSRCSMSAVPNPFNPTSTLTYSLPVSGEMSLTIYDVNGREAVKLYEGYQSAGSYEAVFDGTSLPSGVYFARLQTETAAETQKILLVK